MSITKELVKTSSQSYLSPRCRVGDRALDGRGVFTTDPIRKDELVALWGGSVYTREEMSELPAALRAHVRQVEDGLYMGPRELDSVDGPDLINHSCEPNCGIRGQGGIIALRDIEAGEEVTIDYAMTGVDGEFNCGCGTASCRHWIRPDDFMLPDLRDRYRGYFAQHVEAKLAQVPDRSMLERFEATGAWGILTSLDLHECDPELIRSADAIRQFTYELCDRIKVMRFGEPMIVHFGADERVAGYSLVQLIETSLVSGHFANLTNRVYLDVFSCAWYDPNEMASFAKEFFKARHYNMTTTFRD